MKKKRGKSMKISSSKKKVNLRKKRFFTEEHYPLVALFILTLFCVSLAIAAVNSSMTGNAVTNNVITGNAILDNSPPELVISIAGVLNLPSDNIKDILISVIMLLIIFAGIYDLLELTSFFSNKWVITLIAAGIAIIGALSGVITGILSIVGQLLAGLGSLAVTIEIGVSLLILIGLSVGSQFAARFAAKRYAQKQVVQGIKAGGNIRSAIAGLKEIHEEFKKK